MPGGQGAQRALSLWSQHLRPSSRASQTPRQHKLCPPAPPTALITSHHLYCPVTPLRSGCPCVCPCTLWRQGNSQAELFLKYQKWWKQVGGCHGQRVCL